MRILQVSTADVGGGAESIASQLLQNYRTLGHDAWLAVGSKHAPNSFVWEIPHDQFRSPWAKMWKPLLDYVWPHTATPRAERMRRVCALALSEPGRFFGRLRGTEDFAFPATWHLAELAPVAPDIVHCHNLHGAWLPQGGYFDLRAIPLLSHAVPTVLTLHDAWLLSGHCAHSFDCERWKTGCGDCPDLTIYPAAHWDATDYNWQRKQRIFARSRLYVATPSRWLMDKVDASMLKPACIEQRVIPNGVDLTIFTGADRREARSRLGLPQDARILLFAANGVKQNTWKDYHTMRAALARIAEMMKAQPVLFIALGDIGTEESIGAARIQFVPHQDDPSSVARYYQAADVYVHAAKADTFPSSVIEAAACGVPVVATAVGGIPEQVIDGRTGFLVPAGDAEGMAQQVVRLLEREGIRLLMAGEAQQMAKDRFDIHQQVRAYLDWYDSILVRVPSAGALHHAN